MHKVLSHMSRLENIPKDDVYHFHTRIADLLAEFEMAINGTSDSQAMPPDTMPESETIRIGADTIPAQDESTLPVSKEQDSEDLAKTAGALLDSVQHEQSQKFRESNFLALMRRLRDREVHVEGDEFRDVSSV